MTTTVSNFEGYVIHLASFKDNDAMVSLLYPGGEVSFLARGILKPTSKNAGAMQLLSYSKVSLATNKGGAYSLKESLCLKPIDGRDDLSRLTAFSFLSEFTSKVVQNDEASEVYPWLKATLEALERGADAFSVSLIYFAHVLIIAGYGLNVDECVYCGSKKDIAGISYSDGGFVCKADLDEGGEALDVRNLKILRYIFRCGIGDIDRVKFEKGECQSLFHSLAVYLNDLTGVELKSLTLLLKA